MAAVADNLASKVSDDDFRQAMEDKLSRQEVTMKLQDKVSFEDMKRFMALNG